MNQHPPETFMARTKSAILLALALLTSHVVAAADAATAADHVEAKVSAAGLDLSSEAGAAEFLNRLIVAARQACGQDEKTDLEKNTRYRHCYDQAIVDVVRTINRPVLSQLYATRYPNEAVRFGISSEGAASK
jgi:UrcA family protein